MAGKEYYLGLHLLDRQLVDREGRLGGKVDDLELEVQPDGSLVVTAIVSGPGALATRLRRRRFGRWLHEMHRYLHGEDGDPDRIPFGTVAAIDNHVTIAADASELPMATAERWTADHVIRRIPGSGHAPE
jgi:sporulation protein YlmC with PRC-barrel domain